MPRNRQNTQPPQTFHFDSCILLGVLIPDDIIHDIANDILNRSLRTSEDNPDITLVISQLAIGEAINTIQKRRFHTIVEDIYDKLQRTLQRHQFDIRPLTPNGMRTATRLRNKDSRFDFTDSLICGEALIDPNSVFLFTTDDYATWTTPILICKELLDEDKRHRRINITDSL